MNDLIILTVYSGALLQFFIYFEENIDNILYPLPPPNEECERRRTLTFPDKIFLLLTPLEYGVLSVVGVLNQITWDLENSFTRCR